MRSEEEINCCVSRVRMAADLAVNASSNAVVNSVSDRVCRLGRRKGIVHSTPLRMRLGAELRTTMTLKLTLPDLIAILCAGFYHVILNRYSGENYMGGDKPDVAKEIASIHQAQQACGPSENCLRDVYDRDNALLNKVWNAGSSQQRDGERANQQAWIKQRDGQFGTEAADVTADNPAKPGTSELTGAAKLAAKDKFVEDRIIDLTKKFGL